MGYLALADAGGDTYTLTYAVSMEPRERWQDSALGSLDYFSFWNSKY